ncbi:GNAT family N-acetyltransferase [Candidatus Parcubacteria bacterium]|nr:GNAT family N-acetyltransferase [Candidatus Parcubacteria bacterium]
MDINEIYRKEMKIAEEIYGSQSDPDQIPITEESLQKLLSLSPDTIPFVLDDKGEPISWLVVIPCDNENTDKFLKEEITEREFFNNLKPASHYDALYISSAITVPAHRRKGLAGRLIVETIDLFKHKYGVKRIFAWPWSREGGAAMEKLKSKYDIELRRALDRI